MVCLLYFRRLSLTYQWCLARFPAQDSYNLQLIMIFIEATPLGVVLLLSAHAPHWPFS